MIFPENRFTLFRIMREGFPLFFVPAVIRAAGLIWRQASPAYPPQSPLFESHGKI
jgi:hypothetical protein